MERDAEDAVSVVPVRRTPPPILGLTVKETDVNQDMWAASRGQKRRGNRFSLEKKGDQTPPRLQPKQDPVQTSDP